MFIDINRDRQKQKPKYFLAKPNKQVIANMTSYKSSDSCAFKLGNINELTFSIPYYIDDDFELEYNKDIDLVKEKMLVKMVLGAEVEWFIIDEIEDSGDDNGESMNITAYSLGYELTHKNTSYQEEAVNARTFLTSVLTGTVWKIGTIDTYFENIYRSFDEESELTVLDLILQGAETFDALIEWDTVNRKISFLDLKTNGRFRGMTANYGKLLNNVTRNRTTDEMVTRLYVEGSDGLTIHSVNPTGVGYLENFSFFIYPFERDINKNVIKSSHFMSDELCNALLDHQDLIQANSAQLTSLRTSLASKEVQLSIEAVTLNGLQLELENILDLLDIAQAVEDTVAIVLRKSERDAKDVEIASQQLVVDGLNYDIASLNSQIDAILDIISMEKTFSQALLDELNLYIIEKSWKDDRYIDVQELYDDAVKKFTELREPKIVLSIGLENLLEIVEEQYYWDKLTLGDYIKIKYPQMKMEYLAKIIEINYNFEDGSIDITIANTTKLGNEMEQLKDVLYGAKSASSLIENNKHKWDKVGAIEDEVYKLINEEHDANKRKIIAGIDNSIEIGKRGMTVTSPSNPNDVVIVQSGIIALSKNKGEDWDTAITADGIIAERLIGNVVIGRNLVMTNTSGKFTFDENGVVIDGASLTITGGLPKEQVNLPSGLLTSTLEYNGVKIDGTNGIKVTSSQNNLLLNASKGIEITKISDGSTVFSLDSVTGDLNITGTINMTSGSILWGASGVTAPDYSEINGTKPPTDADNTLSAVGGKLNLLDGTGNYTGYMAYSMVNGAKPPTDADNTFWNLANNGLIKGFYNSGGTLYLNADYINAGTISGNKIYGGTITGVQINVTTDLYVGNNIYLGNGNNSYKYLRFSPYTYIYSNSNANVGLFLASQAEIQNFANGGIFYAYGRDGITLNGNGSAITLQGSVDVSSALYVTGRIDGWSVYDNGYRVATQTWVGSNYATTGHTHSGYASTSHTHSEYYENGDSVAFYTIQGAGGDFVVNSSGRVLALGSYNSTTASASNVYISGSGIFNRSTSSIKYKTDVEDLWESEYSKVLDLRPVYYRSIADLDRGDWSYIGLIAEEVHEVEPRLVHYKEWTKTVIDENGNEVQVPLESSELEVEGVQYDRVAVMLIPIVKKQQEQIALLRSEIEELKNGSTI